jgi:Zn-dependent protease
VESSFRIGSVRGITIGVHYTWLLAFGLVSYSLARGYFPQGYPGWAYSVYWTIGIAAAVLLFVSVLVHELCHSFMAIARGLKVESITLFIFGGVAKIRDESRTAWDEFLVAVVGPLGSLGVAAVFWAIDLAVPDTGNPLDALLNYLALVNALLAVFNLLPGFPLDGGRVLRAILWGASKSLSKATRWSSYAGQFIALVFVAFGFWDAWEGDLLGGLWIGMIGWFLASAAVAARRESELREAFTAVKVRDVMQPDPLVVSPGASVRDLVEQYVLRHGLRAVPVVQADNIVGLVTLSDVKRLPRERWAGEAVAAIMTRTGLRVIGPDADVQRALQMLVDNNINQLMVIDNDELVGMISRADVMRYLQMRQELS